jgi:hypothetical protein
MLANPPALPAVLATLKKDFERASVSTLRMGHCFTTANRPVSDQLVRVVAEHIEGPVARITQQPQEDGSIRYSCFLGSKDRIAEFDRLAAAAEECYVAITQQLYPGAPGQTISPADSWIARAYRGDLRRSDRGLLTVDRQWVHGRESLGPQSSLTWFHDYEETEYDLNTDTYVEGEPLARFYVVHLRHDVFTTSAAMIDHGLKSLPDLSLRSIADNADVPQACSLDQLLAAAAEVESSDSQAQSVSESAGESVSGIAVPVADADAGSDDQTSTEGNDEQPQGIEDRSDARSGATRDSTPTSAPYQCGRATRTGSAQQETTNSQRE